MSGDVLTCPLCDGPVSTLHQRVSMVENEKGTATEHVLLGPWCRWCGILVGADHECTAC